MYIFTKMHFHEEGRPGPAGGQRPGAHGKCRQLRGESLCKGTCHKLQYCHRPGENRAVRKGTSESTVERSLERVLWAGASEDGGLEGTDWRAGEGLPTGLGPRRPPQAPPTTSSPTATADATNSHGPRRTSQVPLRTMGPAVSLGWSHRQPQTRLSAMGGPTDSHGSHWLFGLEPLRTPSEE